MQLAEAHLERWMRQYYFDTELDIGSSGVECFSFAELRKMLGISNDELDEIVFSDSRTLGDPGLRNAIAARWFNGRAENVMATHGSSEAIFMIMQSLLAARDEVIVLKPCYQQLYSIAESIGCNLKFWTLRYEEKFRPDIDEIKKLITPNTKMVIANFPHNPTGTTLSRDEQNELIKAVSSVGAYLVWDGAFADLVYDGDPLPEPGLDYNKAISIGTLSKAYGLPGLRVGWCLADEAVLDRFVHLRDYTTLHLSPFIELIARRVIENADQLLSARLAQARRNLAVLSEWMQRHEGVLGWVPPLGGVCSFIRFLNTDDTEPFCRALSEDYKTLIVPGSTFRQPEHVRLGFGCSTSELTEGLSRFSNLLDRRP